VGSAQVGGGVRGSAVYAVFTNRELADIARGKPASIVELKKIDGIGEGKYERYGERFLLAIAKAPDEKDRVPF
jgi:ATP-dependent DNA helicase RecQ